MIDNILTIAGTDPSGGAGIQADIKTFSALGGYATSAITAVVAQNTQGVRSCVALEPAFVADQIDAVLEDVRIDAVKIGMIANARIAGPDGTTAFSAPRIATRNDHGTGCTLSSAIAALLPLKSVKESIGAAKDFLQGALATSDALDVGSGYGPVHHFHRLWARERQ